MPGCAPRRYPARVTRLLVLLVTVGSAYADTRIVAIADTRGNSGFYYVNTNELNTIIDCILDLEPAPDAVTMAGDLVVDLNNIDGDFTWFTNCMRRLTEQGIPYYCALGNHDTWGSASWYETWQATFDYPANGPPGTTDLVYYVDVGDARLLMLDQITDYKKVPADQREWLASVAGTNSPAPFDFVFGHLPAYSASTAHQLDCLDAYPSERDAFLQTLVDVRCAGYLYGHEHLVARRTVDTRYNANWTYPIPHICNCAGAGLHSCNSLTPLPEAAASCYGFTVLDLDPVARSGTATTYGDDGATVLDVVGLRGKILAAFTDRESAALESAGAGAVTVALAAAAPDTVVVQYAVAGGTASNGADFVLESGALTFSPGQTNKAVDLSLLEDDALEPDETVTLRISHADYALVGTQREHVFTILDNDGPDSDRDTLPDAWEEQIIDADTNDPISNVHDVLPDADYDGDDADNRQEFVCGTNPTVSGDLFAVNVALSNPDVFISFHALEAFGPGYDGYLRRYRLESADNPAVSNWSGVTDHTNILATNQTVRVPAQGSGSVFRGQVWLEEP